MEIESNRSKYCSCFLTYIILPSKKGLTNPSPRNGAQYKFGMV